MDCYVAVDRKGCIEIEPANRADWPSARGLIAGDLTTTFRRAAMMAGWPAGVILEEVAVVQQEPHLVFLEEQR